MPAKRLLYFIRFASLGSSFFLFIFFFFRLGREVVGHSRAEDQAHVDPAGRPAGRTRLVPEQKQEKDGNEGREMKL